ncbi:MAG: hypothetical protein HN348_01025 [Proteobacteria bacterium]|jgi:hypothetical protein|nr:hypothetical protein [Pseudomonadota bacterium]
MADDLEDGDFASLAKEKRRGLFGELLDYLSHNKKWWLTPILIVFLLMGLLMYLSGTAAAPLIYTLF